MFNCAVAVVFIFHSESAIAVGTGFGQLFRGIGEIFAQRRTLCTHDLSGQVGGVALSAALFQSLLNAELHKRITGEGAEEVGNSYCNVSFLLANFVVSQTIRKIRHSATLVAHLPPELQRAARDSYAVGLRAVFIMAACSTFIAYLVRLPVSCIHVLHVSFSTDRTCRFQTNLSILNRDAYPSMERRSRRRHMWIRLRTLSRSLKSQKRKRSKTWKSDTRTNTRKSHRCGRSRFLADAGCRRTSLPTAS